MNKALSFAALASLAEARMSLGACPAVDYVENLDMTAYSGKWYEIEADPMFPFTMGTDCLFKEFTMKPNDEQDMDLWFGGWNLMMGGYFGVDGKMWCDPSMDKTCEATMGSGDKKSPFGILATDYSTYDIGYVCMQMVDSLGIMVKADFYLIYGREATMSEEKLNEARDIIREKVPEYNYDWQLH